MPLTPPSFAPRPSPPRSILAWVLATVLVATGAAAVVVASLGTYHTHGSLTVTDDFGNQVQLTPNPQRVVALGPNIVDIMSRLGLLHALVGVDCFNGTTVGALESDYTSAQIASWGLAPSMCVEAYPFVPSTLANLTPDLVLASTIVQAAAVEQVTAELGIPLVWVQPDAPSGVLYDDVLVGSIFGATGAANELNAQLASELYNASVVTGSAASFPTVLATYSVDAGGYWTYGPGSFGDALLALAGATSVGAGAVGLYPELAPAVVLAAQPDWIVYATGFGLTLSSYQSAPDWSDLNAVHAGNLTGVDSTLFTEAGPTMILVGLPTLLAILHPA